MNALRFGLRDLLWATALIAVLLGWWLEQPSRRQWLASWFQPAPLPVRVYYISDLAPIDEQPFASALVQEVRREVTPDDWNNGASIQAFETNHSMVIAHTREGHDQVALFLENKRSEHRPKPLKSKFLQP